MLKLQFKDRRSQPFWLMEKSLTIGSGGRNGLIIAAPSVSENHAKIINRDNIYIVKDLSSAAGTYVNERPVTQKQVGCGDTIRVGDIELEIIDPFNDELGLSEYWALIGESGWLRGQEFPLLFNVKESLIMGRGNDCDIYLPGSHLSRYHTELRKEEDTILVRDLSSANGTFINDEATSEGVLCPGDRLRLDIYSFRLFGPGINMPRSTKGQQPKTDQEEEMEDLLEHSDSPRWRLRPTSVGNREEVNLYKKEITPALFVSVVATALIGAVGYVVLGVLGLI